MHVGGAGLSLGLRLPRLARMAVALGIAAWSAVVLWPSPALAAVRSSHCPPASAGGSPVGSLTVGDAVVPIVPVTYPAGGTLTPPPTNRAIGLSTRHKALFAAQGTSVLTWHVRYGNGCPGTANALITAPVGSTFEVAGRDGVPHSFRIDVRDVVPLGEYPKSWFVQSGPHRLALFTCTDLRGGAFHKTVAIFASPVAS